MPYTRISHSVNGKAAIEYVLGGKNGKGHNGNKERNLYLGAVNMVPDETGQSYAEQMNEYWKKASSKNKNQVRRIVISFSKEELKPDEPNSALVASEIARQFAMKYYPDRQAVIAVQNDGKGGCIHVHIIVNNVSMDDYKGCTDEQTKYFFVAKGVDEISKDYIIPTMDYDDKFDKHNHGRIKRPKDNVMLNERRLREQNEASPEQKYIWKDDLKNRVRKAMSEAKDRDNFFERLTANGVEGELCNTRRQGDYILYELTDVSRFGDGKIPANLKSKSYKMGTDYGLDALDETLNRRSHRKLKSAPETTHQIQKSAPEKTSWAAFNDDAAVQEELKRRREEYRKESREKARKLSAWSKENGYVYYDEINGLDTDAYNRALAAYEKAMSEQKEEPVKAEPDRNYTTVEHEPVYHKGKKHTGKIAKPVQQEQSAVQQKQVRQPDEAHTVMMIRKLRHDADELDVDEIELQGLDIEQYGKPEDKDDYNF